MDAKRTTLKDAIRARFTLLPAVWILVLAAVVFYRIGRRAGAVDRSFEEKWKREDERYLDELRRSAKR